MPIIKSAKKRVKTAHKAAIRNSKTKRQLKSTLKAFSASVEAKGSSAAVTKAYNEAQAAIDTAVKKHVIHKNKAAREKARLSLTMKSAGIKHAPSKSPVKKPAAKKAPAKAPTTKTTKKPAAKPKAKK